MQSRPRRCAHAACSGVFTDQATVIGRLATALKAQAHPNIAAVAVVDQQARAAYALLIHRTFHRVVGELHALGYSQQSTGPAEAKHGEARESGSRIARIRHLSGATHPAVF